MSIKQLINDEIAIRHIEMTVAVDLVSAIDISVYSLNGYSAVRQVMVARS